MRVIYAIQFKTMKFDFSVELLRRARVLDIRCSWCFVVGVLLGQKGSVVSIDTLSSQTHFLGKAKLSATAIYSRTNKNNARSHVKLTQVKVVVVVLTKNRCLVVS